MKKVIFKFAFVVLLLLCSFVAKGPSREELKPFQNYSSHLVDGISERQTLIKEYQKYINEGVTKFSAAQIENRIKK